MEEQTAIMDTYAIGIDVGGTTIKSGAVDSQGHILARSVADARGSEGPPVVIQQIIGTIEELLPQFRDRRCVGVGLGSPGVVSLDGQTVSHPPNLAGWNDVPLAKEISRAVSLPVKIENDANVAALAEARFGAGVAHRDFIFVIWGTGVGGGIILNRQVYRGSRGGAGEIGHVSIDHRGPACNCGNFGCVESFIGQRYLSARTRELLANLSANGGTSRISDLVEGNLDRIEPYIISVAAEQGDRVAMDILKEAGELMGYALASVVNILDIPTIVVGGGISAAPQFVYNAIESSLRTRVLKPHQPYVRVLRATLGNAAGIIGAASLVME